MWGHDHDGAHRQLPVRDPHNTYMVLLTSSGVTLWRHTVLLFGAVSCVLGYNRVGAALVILARTLLGIPRSHYVDDYTEASNPTPAPSSGVSAPSGHQHLRLSRTRPHQTCVRKAAHKGILTAHNNKLTHALLSALLALRFIIATAKPRTAYYEARQQHRAIHLCRRLLRHGRQEV